jgi:hypothetical protein
MYFNAREKQVGGPWQIDRQSRLQCVHSVPGGERLASVTKAEYSPEAATTRSFPHLALSTIHQLPFTDLAERSCQAYV